ncbi:acyltransferase family protein [Paenibacillus gansuensis]|uniref:Acyltransferase family protein n=1 Tax=Paenibacillus gansuensis TaxID=306542 RepID=A0ABW5PA42_9BACL
MNKRLELIQASRALVPLLVIAFHVAIVMRDYFDYNFLHAASLEKSGGVDYFFVLSGFMIFFIYYKHIGAKEKFKSYLISRMIRIYPVYWVLTLSLIPVYFLMPAFGGGHETQPGVIIRSLLLLPQENAPILTVAWSLTLTLLYYLAFSLMFILPRFALWALYSIWAALIIFGVTGFLTFDENMYLETLFHPLLLESLGGSVCAFIVLKTRPAMGLAPVILGVGGYVFAWVNGVYEWIDVPASLLYGVSSMLLIAGLGFIDTSRQINVGKVLNYIGNASFSIYLTNFITISLCAKLFQKAKVHEAAGGLISSILMIAFAVAAGCIVHTLLEKPIGTKLKHRVLGRSGPVSARNRGTNVLAAQGK